MSPFGEPGYSFVSSFNAPILSLDFVHGVGQILLGEGKESKIKPQLLGE